MKTVLPKQEIDRLFNEGSEARLRGEPLSQCPYTEPKKIAWFRLGWMDVHEFWGKWARWPVRVLPPVKNLFVGYRTGEDE